MPIWISVKSKLPDNDRFVLVYIPTENMYLVDNYDIEYQTWLECRLMRIEPSHWMELPNSPRIK